MAASVNLTGNILADPELRRTDGKPDMFTCRIMVDRFKMVDGSPVAQEGYSQSIAYMGDKAKTFHRLLKKGYRICVEGSQEIGDLYTDKDKVQTRQFKVYANQITLALSESIHSIVRHKDLVEAPSDDKPAAAEAK